MSRGNYPSRFFAWGAAALGWFILVAAPAQADVTLPDCAALEAWVTTIDPEQRWTPVEGDKASLPQAFQEDDFVALFGKPAMDWTADDAEAVAAAVYECGQTAGREGRREIRQSLYSARGIFLRDLRHALRTAEQVEQAKQREAERAAEARRRQEARAAQAQADLEQALDRLMAESDSPELLHDLGVLTAMGPQAGTAQRPAEPLRLDSARRFAQILQRMEKGTGDPAVGPQLDARFKSAHEAMMKEQRATIEGMNESTNSVRALYQIIPTLEQELGPALTDADKEALGEAVVKKAESIREAIVARGKKLIDDAGDGASGIQSIEKIVGQIAGAGLRPPQAAELKTYARTRLQSLADGVLVEAETSLDTIPDTLAGMQAVVDLVDKTGNAIRNYASQTAVDRFSQAAAARMTDIARQSLPAFEEQLAALPDDQSGLETAEERLAFARNLAGIEDSVRQAYVSTAEKRHDAIASALKEAREERRRETIAAGGDPDLVGYSFVEPNTGSSLEFRDKDLVILNMMGFRGAGSYQRSLDDVIIEAPHGSLVFTLKDDTLIGLGLEFKRKD